MASNMTTSDKLKHPVTAIKQMMGKDTTGTNVDNAGIHTGASTTTTGAPFGHTGTTTGATNLQNEGLPHNKQPLNVSSEEQQLSNEMGGINLGTTAGMGNKPVYSESAGTAQDPLAHRHAPGHHVGEGVAAAGAGGVGAYEAEKHLGGHHQGHHPRAHVETNQTGGYGHLDNKDLKAIQGHHTGTHIAEGVTGAGVGGVGAYEAGKHLGHHNRTGDNIHRTGDNITGGALGSENVPHDHQHHGHHVAEGAAGAGVGGVGVYEAEKHLGHHKRTGDNLTGANRAGDNLNRTGDNLTGGALGSEHVPHHQQHHGHHVGEGVAGAGAGGLGAYEAEKHLGHHNRTGDSNITGVNRTGDNVTGGGLGSEHVPHHHQHHGHHVGEGVAGAGVGGVGAYEAEKHLGGHHRPGHNNQSGTMMDTSATAGTGTGLGGGRVFTPEDSRTHNVGLNVVGMNTPNFSRDIRDHDDVRATAENPPTMGTGASRIDESRVNATSLPANPLMSALTGGKIPPSIHKGAQQAGIDTDRGHGGASDFMGGNTGRAINEGTGIQDANRTGRFDDTNQTGLTGNTTRTGYTGSNTRDVV